MNEKCKKDEIMESLISFVIVFGIILYFIASSGMIIFDKPEEKIAQPIQNVSMVTVFTPEPTITPEAIPTLNIDYVDPFTPGDRSLGQWYKFYRADVQGLKDLQIGIVAYRYRFLDRYTWWNPSTGNYYTQRPEPGQRYFAVWIHEEMIGNSTKDDPGFWAFDDRAFGLQVKDRIMASEINESFNPVVRIKEFDYYYDFYNTVTAPPFGYQVLYTGKNPESGGFLATKIGVLRMGPGNAHDGFIIYEIPKETQLTDISLIGEFGTFGSARWYFDV